MARRRYTRRYYTPAPIPVTSAGPSGQVIIDRFEHPADFARAADAAIPAGENQWRNGPEGWAGGTFHGALKKCVNGRTDRIAQATALYESITFQVDTPRSVWQAAPCGAYPIVPAFLTGHPDSMRRRQRLACESAPIALYLDTVSSSGIDADRVEKRGVAFLALAMALSNIRPVEVFAVIPESLIRDPQHGPHSIVVIRIPSTPLDLASACGILTTPAATRLLGYGLNSARIGGTGNWYRGLFPESKDKAEGYLGYGRDKYSNAIRADLGLGEGDFYMPGVALGDPLTEDPVGFIQRAVTEAAALEGGA